MTMNGWRILSVKIVYYLIFWLMQRSVLVRFEGGVIQNLNDNTYLHINGLVRE